MNQLKKVLICLIINIILLFSVIFFVTMFASESKYFRFGPNEDFIVISVKINNQNRYNILLSLISLVKITKVIIEEIGNPIMDFSIYNPDKKIITEFTKNQLFIIANLMYLVSSIRYVFEVMITVTQIDIAIFSVFATGFAGLVSTRFLLNEKTFITEYNNLREDEKSPIEQV